LFATARLDLAVREELLFANPARHVMPKDPQVSINPIAMVAICPGYLLWIYHDILAQREQPEHLFTQ